MTMHNTLVLAEKLIEQGVRLIGVVVERHHNTFITLNPRCHTSHLLTIKRLFLFIKE